MWIQYAIILSRICIPPWFSYNSPQPTESATKYYFQNEEKIFLNIIELLSNINNFVSPDDVESKIQQNHNC